VPDHATSDAAELTALAEALLTIQRELPRFVHRLYVPRPSLGLAQLRVLGELRRHGPLHVGELAEVLQVRLPTMTQSLDRLEAQGWVRRSTSTTDRRNIIIHLTTAGERAHERAHAEVIEQLRRRLATLSADDRAALGSVLPALERLRQE